MDKTLYELVPVSVKPEKRGKYWVIDPNIPGHSKKDVYRYDKITDSWFDDGANCYHPSHYLRPLPPPVAEERTFTLAEAIEIYKRSALQCFPFAGLPCEFADYVNENLREDFKKQFNITLPE